MFGADPLKKWEFLYFKIKLLTTGGPLIYLIDLLIIVRFLQFNVEFWGLPFLNDPHADKTANFFLRPRNCAVPE